MATPAADPAVSAGLRGSSRDFMGLDAAELRPGLRRLLVSVRLVRRTEVERLPRIKSAADVFEEFRSLADLDREVFVALLLDQKNRITGINVVSVGCLSGTVVHPRETFKTAILANSAAILVLHNHPSGDPSPSTEDRELTVRLKACGELLGIPLLDHVVIGEEAYYSFAESGLI